MVAGARLAGLPKRGAAAAAAVVARAGARVRRLSSAAEPRCYPGLHTRVVDQASGEGAAMTRARVHVRPRPSKAHSDPAAATTGAAAPAPKALAARAAITLVLRRLYSSILDSGSACRAEGHGASAEP